MWWGFHTQGDRAAKIHSRCICIAEANCDAQTCGNAQARLCADAQTYPDTDPHEAEDEYGARDYDDVEDFYDDHYDDFDGFEDAEDYWDDMND